MLLLLYYADHHIFIVCLDSLTQVGVFKFQQLCLSFYRSSFHFVLKFTSHYFSLGIFHVSIIFKSMVIIYILYSVFDNYHVK